MVLIRAFLIWFIIIAAETVHGILRGILLVPIVGDLPARQMGVLVGSLLIFGVAIFSSVGLPHGPSLNFSP